MAVLHLLSRSPQSGWEPIVQRIVPGDAVLLLADGVYGVNGQARRLRDKGVTVAVLQDDLQARGLVVREADIRVVDLGGFVDLTVQYERILSW